MIFFSGDFREKVFSGEKIKGSVRGGCGVFLGRAKFQHRD
jgi:hypothetical protein